VAGNLISLGRLEEAAASLREARGAATDPFADRAARQWRDLVQVELARRRRPEAAAEMARFLDLARAAPAYFRGQALLAQSDMRMEAGEYGEALESIQSARQAMKGDSKAADFDYELVNLLMTCVLDAMNTLPYAEALTLSRRIDTEFQGLP